MLDFACQLESGTSLTALSLSGLAISERDATNAELNIPTLVIWATAIANQENAVGIHRLDVGHLGFADRDLQVN